MINNVNARGTSFKGVAAYLMNGERGAENPDRVAFTATSDNLGGVTIECAAKMMAYTDMSRDESGAGRKSTKGAVFHFSLSWAKDESPDHQHQEQTGHAAVKRLKLQDHEYFIVGHNDKTHDHIHIVVNLTHPETLKRGAAQWSHRALSDFARQYEREHGIKCEAREENRKRHKNGEHTKHQDEKQDYAAKVTAAFESADNGKSFIHALKEQGLELGRAKRGKSYVIVDEKGDVQSLSRQLDIKERSGAKTKAINSKLSDLQQNDVRDGDEISARIKGQLKKTIRETEDVGQQNKMLDAADAHAKKVAATEKTAERKAAAREFYREKAYQDKVKDTNKRHESERDRLEIRFEETARPQLKKLTNEADQLREKVEGRGFKLTLRRMWRGRQDREELAALRESTDAIKKGMEDARKNLAEIHAKEKAELAAQHERSKQGSKSPDEQIRSLEWQSDQQRQRRAKKLGGDRPGVFALDPEQARITQQISKIRDAQEKQRKDAAAEREQAAQRPKFYARQVEIDRQAQKGTVQADESRQERADQIRRDMESRSDAMKDKPKDFER